MLRETLIVIDFETTGLSPGSGDRITEVAAVRIDGERIVDRFESLVDCGVKIPPFITAYTGITQRMVDGAPPVTEVLRKLRAFIGRVSVVAHNASFDHRFYCSECEHVGEPSEAESFICSMRVSRRVYPGLKSHALGSLAKQLGISYPGTAHRAGADAEVTANLMISIARELQTRHSKLSIDSRVLRQLMSTPIAAASSRLARMNRDMG